MDMSLLLGRAFIWAEGQVPVGVIDPAIEVGGASRRVTANAYLSTGRGTGVDRLDVTAVDCALKKTSEGAMPWSGWKVGSISS